MQPSLFLFLAYLTSSLLASEVWFQPSSLNITPQRKHRHAVLTCRASLKDCPKGSACIYKWRTNGSLPKENIDVIDAGKSLFFKAPLSEKQHGGSYTCYVKKKKGGIVGEATTTVTFNSGN